MSGKDDFKRRMGELDAQGVTRFDQQLQEFRLTFNSMDAGERLQIRKWLSAAAELGDKTDPSWGGLSLRVCI